jgi:hypothetical protein
MGKKKWAPQHMVWFSTEDSYKQGMLPDTTQTVLSERLSGVYPSFKKMQEALSAAWGLPENLDAWGAFSGENGRIDVQFLVDENNSEPSKQDIALWKKGRKKLWTIDASITVLVGELEYPSSATISKMAGIQEL